MIGDQVNYFLSLYNILLILLAVCAFDFESLQVTEQLHVLLRLPL